MECQAFCDGGTGVTGFHSFTELGTGRVTAFRWTKGPFLNILDIMRGGLQGNHRR